MTPTNTHMERMGGWVENVYVCPYEPGSLRGSTDGKVCAKITFADDDLPEGKN